MINPSNGFGKIFIRFYNLYNLYVILCDYLCHYNLGTRLYDLARSSVHFAYCFQLISVMCFRRHDLSIYVEYPSINNSVHKCRFIGLIINI